MRRWCHRSRCWLRTRCRPEAAQGERVGPRGRVDREGPPEPAPVQPPTSALVFAEPMASRSEHTAPLPVSSVVVVTEIVPAAAATPASMSGTTATMSAAAEASASHRARARGAVAREALGMERTPCSKSETTSPRGWGVSHGPQVVNQPKHATTRQRRLQQRMSPLRHEGTRLRCRRHRVWVAWCSRGARSTLRRDPRRRDRQVGPLRAHVAERVAGAGAELPPGRSVLLLDCASKEPRERASQAPTPRGDSCAKRRDRVAVRSVTPPTAAVMTLVVFTVVGGSVCERRVVSLLTSRSSDQAWR